MFSRCPCRERRRWLRHVQAVLALTIILRIASADITPRFHHTSTTVNSSVLITIGGTLLNGTSLVTNVPSTNVAQQITQPLAETISVTGHSAVSLGQGKVMLLFGQTQILPTSIFADAARILDLSSGALSTLPANGIVPTSRIAHTTTIVDNKVFLIGGQVPDPNTPKILSDVSYLDLTSQAWTSIVFPKTHPPPPIALHSTVAVNNHLVSCFGLNENNLPRSDCIVFDTNSMTYINVTYATAIMPPPRTYSTMVLGPNGQSLIAFGGGNDMINQYYNDLWVLDVSKIPVLTWSQQNTIAALANVTPSGRSGHSAALVGPKSNIMIIFGGQTSVAVVADSSFYYLDLTAMKWISGATAQTFYSSSSTPTISVTVQDGPSSAVSNTATSSPPPIPMSNFFLSSVITVIAVVVAVTSLVIIIGIFRRWQHHRKNKPLIKPSSQMHTRLGSRPNSILGPPADSALLVQAPPKASRWLGRNSVFSSMDEGMMVDGQFSTSVNMVELKRGDTPSRKPPGSSASEMVDEWFEDDYEEENATNLRKSSKPAFRPKRKSSLPNILVAKEASNIGAAFMAGNRSNDGCGDDKSALSVPPTPASISDAESNGTQSSTLLLTSVPAATEQTKRRLTLNLKPVALFRAIGDSAMSSSSPSSAVSPILPSNNMISPTSANAVAAAKAGKTQQGKRNSGSFFVNRRRQQFGTLPSPITETPDSPGYGHRRVSGSSVGKRSVASLQWVGFDHKMDSEAMTRKSMLVVRNLRDSLNSNESTPRTTPRNSLGKLTSGHTTSRVGSVDLHLHNLGNDIIEYIAQDDVDNDDGLDNKGFQDGEQISDSGYGESQSHRGSLGTTHEYTTSQQNIDEDDDQDADDEEQSSTPRASMSPGGSPPMSPKANQTLSYNEPYSQDPISPRSDADNDIAAYDGSRPASSSDPTLSHKRSTQLSRLSFGIQDQEHGIFEEPADEAEYDEDVPSSVMERANLATNLEALYSSHNQLPLTPTLLGFTGQDELGHSNRGSFQSDISADDIEYSQIAKVGVREEVRQIDVVN
ncbi:hypothetical protein BC937DRAFT_89550 [Endogone sp. FLAS-F59071]|nr:hypothetical protein BC937DRAFT_89550 [Endogone sp. FLAS-F59071]|eukprot:RUS17737.1 hypothetical protein BC937DRAFT_89550 [Endogone sp. FLAS-F59071]